MNKIPIIPSIIALSDMAWDPTKLGTNATLIGNGNHVFLREQIYVFRSAIGNIGFTSGKNYWEIIADSKT